MRDNSNTKEAADAEPCVSPIKFQQKIFITNVTSRSYLQTLQPCILIGSSGAISEKLQTVTSLLHLIRIENQKANLMLGDKILAIANTRSLLSSCIPHRNASGKVVAVHQWLTPCCYCCASTSRFTITTCR